MHEAPVILYLLLLLPASLLLLLSVPCEVRSMSLGCLRGGFWNLAIFYFFQDNGNYMFL